MSLTNQNIKAIIFDMDGVLIDSETVCDRTWEIAATEYGITGSNKIINLCRGTNKTDSIEIIKREIGEYFDAQNYLARTSELFHEIEEKEGIPPMFYAKEALELLSKKYTLALASSTRMASVERLLKKLDFMKYFSTLTTGDMVTHSKPDPEIYLMACKSLNLNPCQCIAIEDSPNGIKSAVSAGIKTIMIPDTIQPTDEIKNLCWTLCSSLKELCNIL